MRHTIKSRKKFLFAIPVILLFAITTIVWWLWNAILPDVLQVKTISFWQAMGILVLSKILFGGFGFKKHHHKKHHYKKHFFNKIKSMTPEERIAFKKQWKQRFHQENCCKNEQEE